MVFNVWCLVIGEWCVVWSVAVGGGVEWGEVVWCGVSVSASISTSLSVSVSVRARACVCLCVSVVRVRVQNVKKVNSNGTQLGMMSTIKS